MSDKELAYKQDSIKTVHNLEHIRLRPTAYLGSVDMGGQLHAAKEIIDNAIDELEVSQSGQLEITLFKDIKNKSYQLAISDTGRGIPVNSVVDCFTVLHTSGKYDTSSYKFSGGLLGIGAKAAAALSSKMKIISKRKNRTAVLYLEEAQVKEFTIYDNKNVITGVTVIFELDKKVFQDMDKFSEEGLEYIIEIFKKLNLFISNVRLLARESDYPLNKDIWNKQDNVNTLVDLINADISKSVIAYDSVNFDDEAKLHYLKNIWNIDGQLGWTMDNLIHDAGSGNLGYKIKMYLPKKIKSSGGSISMVNHVLMRDQTSSHLIGLYDVIKNRVLEFIEDKELKKFFNDNYKLPLFFAIYIKYSGAQFSGTTKDGFKDRIFMKQYCDMLATHLTSQYEREVWFNLFTEIEEDLINKYNLFHNKHLKIKQSKFNPIELNFPNKFHDCKERGNAELFILEGDSASGNIIKMRDSTFQAAYGTKGKPFNSITNMEDRRSSIAKLLKNAEYSDIIKILGIHPDQEDLSTSNFRRININTDADEDGQHIKALHIGNLYNYNPNIVTSGMLYIIKPPLFTLYYKNKKLYLQDKKTYIDALIELIYKNTLDLKILGDDGKIKDLDDATYRELCFLVYQIGELIHEYTDKLAINYRKDISALILEKLIYIAPHLIPGQVNVPAIQKAFEGHDVKFDEINNVLVLGIDQVDIPISLNDFNDIVYEKIIPLLHQVQWKKYVILVTTKFSDLYKDHMTSFTGVYNILMSLNDMFKLDRYKGLAEMTEDDLEYSCINPKTRSCEHIVTVTDVQRIFDLLGSDGNARKELLTDLNI